jgi:GNAT superfamily N-acetyltransferase
MVALARSRIHQVHQKQDRLRPGSLSGCSTSFSLHKGYLPGAIGRVTELHAAYYYRHAGFGVYFESKVANELSEFCERYREDRDGLWLAMVEGRIEGSIVIDASHAKRAGAHLRWFITSEDIQGTSVGTSLISAAVAFCRSHQYERVYLWTFEGLDVARHLYEKSGFRLVRQQSGTRWGSKVKEQYFELLT